MGSFAGNFHRPVMAASAVAAAYFTDFCDKLIPSRFTNPHSLEEESNLSSSTHSLRKMENSLWVSRISASRLSELSFITRIQVPKPKAHIPISNSYLNFHSPLTASSVVFNWYQSVELAKSANPVNYSFDRSSSSSSDVLFRWHLPEPSSIDLNCGSVSKTRTVVVLLGWLGAKQNHLRRYAEWYTSRGFHVITFTFPMSEVLSYQVGGKAEQEVGLLVNHLAEWMDGEDGKNLIFHTFSNTGWLIYGVVLEKLLDKDSDLVERIKGCIVDSAPVAAPDPQVWASGFSAAFRKKNSIVAKSSIMKPNATNGMVESKTSLEIRPAFTETALLLVLEKFFRLVLSYPSVDRRLSDVLSVLTSKQPSCRQLYIYSSADKVIPAGSVDSFIEKQRQSGREVRSCNFVHTPHVDHFRNEPELYSAQLTQFLDDCVLVN